MAHRKRSDDPVSDHELILSQAIELEALMQVLVRKKLITEQEVLDEIRVMKQRYLQDHSRGSA